MARESYNYEENPHIGDFKEFVRDGKAQRHPWITVREKAAAAILQDIETIPVPDYVDHEFLVHPADQGLVLTPFDDFDGMHVAIPPEQHIEGCKILREFNLRLAIHPARIHAMQELEARGFTRPVALDGVLDTEADKRRLLQLADLGHAIDLTGGEVEGERLVDLAEKIRIVREAGEEAIKSSPELQLTVREVETFIAEAEGHKQTHRTELLATGPFTLIRKMAFSYIEIGAMSDITASVLLGRTAAKMFVPFCVPEIGKYADPYVQAQLVKAILDGLTEDDPLLDGRTAQDKQYIVDHWKRCVIVTTEMDPEKALRRADINAAVGASWFRPYGHTVGGDIITTTRSLRKHFPNAIIESGQISSEDIALACEYEGADCENTGVGSGGRCTTALLSQLIPTNALLSWRLRGKLGIPLKGEGSVIDEPIVAALTGFSAVNGSGKFGGTIENPGGVYFLTRDGRTFIKPYRGEASRAFKYLSNRSYATGVPYIPEGEESWRPLIPLEESVTQKIVDQWTRVVLGSVVLGVDAGPFVVSAIQNLYPSPLWQKTRTTLQIQNTH